MSQSWAASDILKVRQDRSVHSTASCDDSSAIVLYYSVLCCRVGLPFCFGWREILTAVIFCPVLLRPIVLIARIDHLNDAV